MPYPLEVSYFAVDLNSGHAELARLYATRYRAQRRCDKLNAMFDGANYVVMTHDEYEQRKDEIDPMVEVTNLMSGKKVLIRKSERGGCCDPSTETYWSM